MIMEIFWKTVSADKDKKPVEQQKLTHCFLSEKNIQLYYQM